MFSLKLFGGACLEGEDGPLTGPAAQRHRLTLLALLACAHPGGLTRDKLTAYLWPERDTEHARSLLKQAVHALRKALGEEVILSAADELRLNPGALRCDVIGFEAALAAGGLERAVELYSGPFLDGFFLRDAPEFERWLDGERAHLARAYTKALERLAEAAAVRGDLPGTVEWWRRLAAEDPFNSRVMLHLMAALEAAGDRAGAIQQARMHAALLEQEFGAQPDPEVMALAERMREEPVIAPSRARAKGNLDATVPAQSLADEDGGAPPELTVTPERPPPARISRRLLAWRTAALPAAATLAFAALLLVVWLLPETSAHPGADTEAAVASSRAIAVLPCANLSRDPEEEYFSDGLTEELISVLAQVRALQVAARTSAFAFKGENRDIREIGETLNVGTLLECSVRREGERVRVTAQLINASDGFHLWSETYERDGTDVFAIQSDLALRIVRALEAELTPAERERIARRPTDSPEAHALYLKGRHFWNQRTVNGYGRALEYFQRAIEVDPQYAQAHAGLAYVYSQHGVWGVLTSEESSVRTRDAALRALELDPELAEAYTVLGGYYHAHAWDSEAAERAHRRALELNPDYTIGCTWYANYLTSMERFDEAIIQRRKAVELDPLSPYLSYMLGSALLAVGRPDEALEHLRNAIELDSMYGEGHAGMARYYEATGRVDDAIRAYRRAIELPDVTWYPRTGLASLLARVGRRDEARAMLGELQAEADRTGIYAPHVAWVLLALDDVEGALAWLERSYQQKHPILRFMGRSRDPRLADDPRYADLLRRIGLPQ
ncbi:MAG: tetratricopeptide repeat protein [Gemmatimonadetes bacterium]|nr:tetratricopeptide repeat protein [Gemmatimonadota bacterium]